MVTLFYILVTYPWLMWDKHNVRIFHQQNTTFLLCNVAVLLNFYQFRAIYTSIKTLHMGSSLLYCTHSISSYETHLEKYKKCNWHSNCKTWLEQTVVTYKGRASAV